jgi:neopullulanase
MQTRLSLLLIVLFTCCSFVLSEDTITLSRVEPPSWWIGMKDPEVQLLVHGDRIAQTVPRIDCPGVTLRETKRTENQNYLFLTLSVSPETLPGSYPIEFVKDRQVAARYMFQLSAREKNSSQRKSFDASDVVYLIMSDRFSNGNTGNDSAPDMFEKTDRSDPNGRHGGDIHGIIDHLDYLRDLGVTALWNTPLMEDNMERTSYHHYAITDFYRIDPRFGTKEEYRSLSDELHKRNMKLIMDVVTNHCGLNYYWMKDLPTADWIHQFKQYTQSNKHISVTYDPYASAYDRNQNLDGWFDHSMPDLNQDNPLVLKYLIQNTLWWIEYAGLDGLRIDTYPYNSLRKIAEWSRAIRDEYPRINIAGECWVSTVQEIAYWQTGVKNFDGYDSHLPTVMDFPLVGDLSSAFNDNNGVNRLYSHFTLDYLYANPRNILIFTENHDLQRFNSTIGGDMRKFKLAYTVLLTVRGIPQLYYGSEIMMAGEKQKGDGDIRRDFPGGWPNDRHNAFTPSGRTSVENEAHDFMKKLLTWRKASPVIASGKMMQFIPRNDCYVYFRYNDEKTIMVVINDNETESRTIDTKRFAEIMHDYHSGYDVISEKQITDLSSVDIAPKTSMIIELKK